MLWSFRNSPIGKNPISFLSSSVFSPPPATALFAGSAPSPPYVAPEIDGHPRLPRRSFLTRLRCLDGRPRLPRHLRLRCRPAPYRLRCRPADVMPLVGASQICRTIPLLLLLLAAATSAGAVKPLPGSSRIRRTLTLLLLLLLRRRPVLSNPYPDQAGSVDTCCCYLPLIRT